MALVGALIAKSWTMGDRQEEERQGRHGVDDEPVAPAVAQLLLQDRPCHRHSGRGRCKAGRLFRSSHGARTCPYCGRKQHAPLKSGSRAA